MKKQTWAEKVEIMAKTSGPEELEGFHPTHEEWMHPDHVNIVNDMTVIRIKQKEIPPKGTKCFMWDDGCKPEFPYMFYSAGELNDRGELMFLYSNGEPRTDFSYENWKVIK